ncbi:Rib/alpha-like domain-containing protein, partial [Aerococcus urinaehominis]
MLGKNNTQARREKMGNKVYKYAIKRLSVGVASVAVAAGILFSSQEQVAQAASETGVEATTPGDTSSADAAQPEAEAPTDPVAQPGEETTAAPGAEEATGKPAEADAPTEEAPAPEASTATPAEDDKLPEGAVNTAEPEAAPADGSVEEPVQPEVKPASSIEPKNLIEKGEEGETVKTRNEVEPRANELTFGKDKDGNIISKEASEAVANKSELAEAKSYEWVKSPEIGDTKAHVKVTYNDGSYDILEVNVQTPNRPEDEPGSNVITSGGTSEADAIEATGNDPRASFTYQGRAWIENEPSFGGGPDDGDQPVAGQKIYLQWRDHKGIISPIFYTTTKADGTFIFDLSRPVLNADGSMTKFTLTGLNGAKTGVRTWAEPLEGYSVVKSGDMYGARFQTRLDRTQENWDFTVGVERIVGGVVQYQRKPNVEGWLAKPESEWVRPDTTDGYWPDNGNYGVMRGKVWYENNETNGGVTNEYLGQPGNGDVWATGMEVVGSYVNDEVARQFDQWRDNNKGYTHDQFKQAQKDIIAAYEAEHGKGSAIAETVVGKVDKDGNYRIPFRGLYGVSRNRQNAPAQISNKITDEEFGELVRDEEVNHSDSRVWDGIVNLRNRHINYDYSYVYPLVGNNDVWMKMYEDNMFQSSYSIGGQLNAGTNISGIQFAILAAQPVHDVTNKDTNENWAKPGDTAESHTKGLHPNQVYKVRWFKDGEAIGEAVEMRSDNLGEFGSVPITVSDDLTDDSVYTSAVFTANDKADNLANALYVDSFIARPVVKKVNQADPVKKGYARVTFLPGEDGAFDNGSGAVYYDVLENYTLKEAQEAAKNSAVPLEIPNVTPADNVYPFQGWKLNTNNKFSSLDATSVKLKDLADADAKLQNGVPVTFVAGYAKEKDAAKYTPAYAETAGEVGKEAKSAAPTFTDKDGKAATPKVNSYKLGEGAPAGATIDEATGVVTYTPTEADAGKTVEVPVVVTYADDSTDNVKAPIKVAQLDDVIDRTDDPSKPTPEGYVRVTLDAGEGAKLKDGQTKKVYDVKKGKSLAENQYPQVEVDPAKKNDYKDPITWTVAPGTPINEQTDIVANATKTEANTNEPVGKDQTVKVGEPVDSDKSIENLTDLPAGTKTSFKEPVDTTTEGQKDATVVVTYPDGSTDEVPVKVNVEKNPTQADTNTPVGKDQTVKVGEPVDSDKSIENLTDLPAGTKTSFKEPVDTTT